MNTIQVKTLTQIHEAQHAILDALDDMTLASDVEGKLKDAYNTLRGAERKIINLVEDTLSQQLNAVKSDGENLSRLAEQIKDSADQLAGVADEIKKASGIVESFVNVGSALIGSGLF